MGIVIIQEETTLNPITLIGKEAGICWGSDTSDSVKNYDRGLECIKSNHGRTLEYPQIYIIFKDYSSRLGRELYTHIGGSPSRLQSSTRYIDYTKNLPYVVPHTIEKNSDALKIYNETMLNIQHNCQKLKDLGIPNEDLAMQLPLALCSTIVMRTNLRQLIDMSKQRMCSRAYWEFRELMNDLKHALANYSNEWNVLITQMNIFHPKCDDLKRCPEKKGCKKYEN